MGATLCATEGETDASTEEKEHPWPRSVAIQTAAISPKVCDKFERKVCAITTMVLLPSINVQLSVR